MTWTQTEKREYAKKYRGPYYQAHKDTIKAYSKIYHKKVNYKYQLAYQKRNYIAFLMYHQLRYLMGKV